MDEASPPRSEPSPLDQSPSADNSYRSQSPPVENGSEKDFKNERELFNQEEEELFKDDEQDLTMDVEEPPKEDNLEWEDEEPEKSGMDLEDEFEKEEVKSQKYGDELEVEHGDEPEEQNEEFEREKGMSEMDIVGLFEDSDELENAEEKAQKEVKTALEEEVEVSMEPEPEPEPEPEVINTTLKVIPEPETDKKLVICKFPPTLLVSSHPQELRSFLRANPKILENPPNTSNFTLLCWRALSSNSTNSDPENFGKSNSKSGSESELESNARLVLWEDGTFTMFVGSVPLDCEFRSEVSFLLEDSAPDLKPVHAEVNTRLQTRFSNLLRNEMIKKNPKVKRQKMEVTSLSDAIQSHHALQQNMINLRQQDRSRRSYHSSRGLTRTFLESSDIEEDEDLI